jgi:hypothetical protein
LFRSQTGSTFPLLLNAATAAGGNLLTDYTDRDDYVVLDQLNVVRFNARLQGYVWGSSLDLPRMRALVDSLLAFPAGVDEGAAAPARFDVGPSPFVTGTRLAWAAPGASGGRLRLAIYDLTGRRLRTLFDGLAAPGPQTAEWDGRDERGDAVPPGVYLAQAERAGASWTRRVLRLR